MKHQTVGLQFDFQKSERAKPWKTALPIVGVPLLAAVLLLALKPARESLKCLCNLVFAASEAVNAYAYGYFTVADAASPMLALVLLAAALAVWALWPKQPGKRVTITVDGMEQGSYALAADTEITIAGYGGYSLRLVIQNGKAHVEDSTCPDLICQKHSAVSKAGQQIICLPARIVLTVTDDEEAEFDAVAQ